MTKAKVKPKIEPKAKAKLKPKTKQGSEKPDSDEDIGASWFLVAIAVPVTKQNLMVKVKANNHYTAVLNALKKYRKVLAESYPTSGAFVEDNWEHEIKALVKYGRELDTLIKHLAFLGFLVSVPLKI